MVILPSSWLDKWRAAGAGDRCARADRLPEAPWAGVGGRRTGVGKREMPPDVTSSLVEHGFDLSGLWSSFRYILRSLVGVCSGVSPGFWCATLGDARPSLGGGRGLGCRWNKEILILWRWVLVSRVPDAEPGVELVSFEGRDGWEILRSWATSRDSASRPGAPTVKEVSGPCEDPDGARWDNLLPTVSRPGWLVEAESSLVKGYSLKCFLLDEAGVKAAGLDRGG